MCKTLVTITAALAVVSLGSLVSDRAQAGGSQSAPTKYSSRSTQTATVHTTYQVRTNRQVRAPDVGITEFSSSSANNPARPR
jgi:hypothetical protein